MSSSEKLHKYRAALASYMTKYNRGLPPIHFPTREDYGIKSVAEIFVAERIEKEFPKPDPKIAPPPPPPVVRILEDDDIMPFGKHIGKKMREVPPAYFHYLWNQGMRNDMRSSVADYIRRNLESYKKRFKSNNW